MYAGENPGIYVNSCFIWNLEFGYVVSIREMPIAAMFLEILSPSCYFDGLQTSSS